MLKGSTFILILLVLLFIWVFVIPIARDKARGDGVGVGGEGYLDMSQYQSDRSKMISTTNQIYNQLGSSLDPLLPNFAVANSQINPSLTNAQYVQQFNSTTNDANQKIVAALQTPDQNPTLASPTNMGLVPQAVTPQLPPANELYVAALKCQANLNGRASCSQLNDPANKLCGICIKGGTKFDGSSADSWIGGLLSIFQDRRDQEDAAAGGDPIYQPSLGKCPPGMFYVDSAACIKAVNQLNCKEIGETGGFQGGSTVEGLKLGAVQCAQAPAAGKDVFVYQPSNQPYTVTLRVITPFNTGITKVVATHRASGKSFSADNNGNAGQEFTVRLMNVAEEDIVDVLVIQEVPNRTNGQSEVFMVKEMNAGGNGTYNNITAKSLCKRLGTVVATGTQVNNALQNGLQSATCGMTGDKGPMYAAQTGSSDFKLIPVGGAPSSGSCPTANGVWCYGFKPAPTTTNITQPNAIGTSIGSFFESFGTKTSPAQGVSIYSQYSSPGESNPPGNSNRAVILQWEMTGSSKRTVSFMQTITMINGFPAPSVMRLLGPYTDSSIISGPRWSSQSAMLKNQMWFWSNQPRSQTAVFTAQVPGYLNNPYYRDDIPKVPMGPLISRQSTSALLQTSPCMADGQSAGNYSASCLLQLYQGAGGIPGKGKLSTTNGGLNQLNSKGDTSAITAYLNGLYSSATTGKGPDGRPLGYDITTRMNAMNDAAQQLFGFDIVNPCESIVDNADGSIGIVPTPMTDITSECLQYLWLNAGNDSIRTSSNGATYTRIQDRFSGLLKTESTALKRQQNPFQACQVTGSMAPIKNGKPDKLVVNQLLTLPSVKAIQDFFDDIHKTANNFGNDYTGTKTSAAAQAVAIQQCYGIKQAKASTVGYGCGDWTPQRIAGLQLWLDGADPDGTGEKKDAGKPLKTWVDKSGLRNSATANGNPSLATLSGRTCVFFDGTSSFTGSLTNNSKMNTVFVVVMMAGQATNNSRIVSLANNGDVDYSNSSELLPLYQPSGTTAIGTGRSSMPPGGGKWSFPVITSGGRANVPYIAGSIYDYSQASLYVNGVMSGSMPTSGVFNITDYGIGNYSCAPSKSEPFKGLIGEVLVYSSALTNDERQQVEGYLAWKWGLQKSLPSSHNFVTSPVGGNL